MTKLWRRWLIAAVASASAALVVSGINMYRVLTPDYVWCAKHHMTCHWGGAMEPDEAWWGDEPRLHRLEAAVAKAVADHKRSNP